MDLFSGGECASTNFKKADFEPIAALEMASCEVTDERTAMLAVFQISLGMRS